MSQKNTTRAPKVVRSAESALRELLTHIMGLVESQSLDSRCAAKLVRRITKEYVPGPKSGKPINSRDRLLQDVFEAFDEALNAEDARFLAGVDAALRAADNARGADSKRRGVEVSGTTTV